ncbi:uncharacterized protein LOC144120403 [Amblyomma americanum]
MEGNLGLKDTRKLLRCLLEPENTEDFQQRNAIRIVHKLDVDDSTLIKNLKYRYLTTTARTTLPEYSGPPNPELDEDISTWEVRAALHKLRTTSAPGGDKITNKTLRNLDENSIQAVTKLFNKHWREGTLPP